MSQFRKKPVVIEAERFDDDFRTKYYGTAHRTGISFHHDYALIQTLEGTMRAELGDWIITGVKGERYPCKPDIFSATYEAVEPSVTSLPPSAPQATGGTQEWARSPFDTGECCCNIHGEDGRLACPIHGLTARLPAAREAPADGSVSTVNDGESREKVDTTPNSHPSSAVPTPPEAEHNQRAVDQITAILAAEREMWVSQAQQQDQRIASLAADLARVTRERDELQAAFTLQANGCLEAHKRAEVAEQALTAAKAATPAWQIAEGIERVIRRIETGAAWMPQPESAGHLRGWLLDNLKGLAIAARR